MAINSVSFLLFFVVVFVLYYVNMKRQQVRWQNAILLAASYFFYGYADLKMLPLFAGVTVVFFFLGQSIEKKADTRAANWLLTLGVVIGVGMLVYFKYTNFFIEAFADLLGAFGLKVNVHTFNIIMPLGISFFVFRLLSYLIEIHRGMMPATCDFVSFATYVAFFPCMLSGPIDRPDAFLPQLQKERLFSRPLAVDGLRQILWGMFKKMAVADTLAVYVDTQLATDQIGSVSGSTMLLVILAYTFQIYADFSGYSDMAIGVGKLLGIKVAKNFRYPFFALNIADFWHRWHISLTSWMTDYVYLPLSFTFRSMKKWGMILAILINFLIVGIWHGANWNYLIYGFYHGLLFIPLIFMGKMNTSKEAEVNKLGLPVLIDFGKMLLTFVFVAFGMIIFRSVNMEIFTNVIDSFGRNLLSMPNTGKAMMWLLVAVLLLVEWLQRKREYGLDLSAVKHRAVRWGIYFVLIFLVFQLGGGEQHFIYQVF